MQRESPMKSYSSSTQRLLAWQFGVSFIVVSAYVIITLLGGGLSASMTGAIIVTLILCSNKVTFNEEERHPAVLFAGPAVVNTLVPILFAIWTPVLVEDKICVVFVYVVFVIVWNARMRMDGYFTKDHILFPVVTIFFQAVIVYLIFIEEGKAFICQTAEKLL